VSPESDRPEGPDQAAPAGETNGFDAPSGNGYDAPDGEPGRPARPAGNGHPAPLTAGPGVAPGSRGRWIVPLGVVSAVTGMLLLVGAFVGTSLGRMAGLEDLMVLGPASVGAMAGGLAGVWAGSWVAIRLSGGDRTGRWALMGVCGTAAMVGGVALAFGAAKTGFSPLGVLALLAPGIGAAVGDRIALDRKARATGR
jgi:hypothetical protein